MTKKLVHGVGINDADYVVQPTINGKQVKCPFYQTWQSLLTRCYCPKYQAIQPTYIGCSVCEEWLTFSNFKRWMETQDWQGKQLDKDLLFPGNKLYSPDTCTFIDSMTNKFLTDCASARGDLPIGASFHKSSGKFQSQCSNPITKKKDYLGLFSCPIEAHKVWKIRKQEIALQLAELQSDKRAAKALENYLKIFELPHQSNCLT